MTDRPIFFVHVMKTGGGSFNWYARQQFAPHEVYPAPTVDADTYAASTDVSALLSLSDERRADIRLYLGHFPFSVTDRLGTEVETLTLLRDPVERALSFLRMCASDSKRYRGWPIEQIYEHGLAFHGHIHDHQAKVFALGPADRARTIMTRLDLDDARLREAKDNLSRVSLLGLTDRFDEFVAAAGARFGWAERATPVLHVDARDKACPASFRRRIEDDNRIDLEFYAFARELYRERGVDVL